MPTASSSQPTRLPVVLVVSAIDPTVGAGLVADALAIGDCGARPVVVPTGIVDQTSVRVVAYEAFDPVALGERVERLWQERAPDAVKIGAMLSARAAQVLSRKLAELADASLPVVLDPVLASGGAGRRSLADDGLVDAIGELAARCTVITPNATELGALAGSDAPETLEAALVQASALARRHGCAVLAKGGHIAERGADALVTAECARRLEPLRHAADDVHGTGCHLASAVAAHLAHGRPLGEAVEAGRARLAAWVAGATPLGEAGRPIVSHARQDDIGRMA